MRKVAYVAAMFLLAVIALAVALNVHELGHTAVARLAGDSNAMYFLFQHDPGGSTCIGCNIYDEGRLSYLGNIAVTIAGVAVTQSIVLVLIIFGSRKQLSSHKRQIVLLIAFTFLLDAPLQVFQAAHANIASQQHLTRVDLADTIFLIAQRTPLSPTMFKALLVIGMILYFLALYWLYAQGQRKTKNGAKY
jgi:hypothetical protein